MFIDNKEFLVIVYSLDSRKIERPALVLSIANLFFFFFNLKEDRRGQSERLFYLGVIIVTFIR
jgi:hypothetical protein